MLHDGYKYFTCDLEFLKQPLIKHLSIFAAIGFASCRCSIDFKTLSNPSASDTTIDANAKMWQGQYEYLGISITINRRDSLFVKNIVVKPSLENDRFYPLFDHFSMYSYYYGDTNSLGYKGQYEGGYYWQDYSGNTFEKLPTENRKTNKGDSFVVYTVNWRSEKPINFENFSVDVEVLLMNQLGDPATHMRHFNFRGKKDCRFSAH